MQSPQSLHEALESLDAYRDTIRPVAGSTDVSVLLKDGRLKENKLLDISHIDGLKYIRFERDKKVHVGALSSYEDCIRNATIRRTAGILHDAFLTIGSPQIRNLATIAGNLGTASPAGDAIPPLMVLDATIVLQSVHGRREVRIEEFFTGYRTTARDPNELIAEVRFDPVKRDEATFFRKLGLRHANAIALASVAFWGKLRPGPRFSEARIALGAVAPTVIRAPHAEEALANLILTDGRIKDVARVCSSEAKPITDLRGTDRYRRRAVEALLYMGLKEVATQKARIKQSREP